MFYEDVTITAGHPTLDKIVWRYGHKTTDADSIWNHRRNIEIRMLRSSPEKMQPGDVLHIPIPWRVVSTPMFTHASGVDIHINRDGGRGLQLRFVQTVNRDNQPFGPRLDRFCSDPCEADDPVNANEPFYRTRAEIATTPGWRKQLWDQPSRPNPAAAQGTTRWRAVTSIACVTSKRITIFETKVWGFNLTPAGVVTPVHARNAVRAEVEGHLNLLRNSAGGNFTRLGWTFRTPPIDPIGDFNINPALQNMA